MSNTYGAFIVPICTNVYAIKEATYDGITLTFSALEPMTTVREWVVRDSDLVLTQFDTVKNDYFFTVRLPKDSPYFGFQVYQINCIHVGDWRCIKFRENGDAPLSLDFSKRILDWKQNYTNTIGL